MILTLKANDIGAYSLIGAWASAREFDNSGNIQEGVVFNIQYDEHVSFNNWMFACIDSDIKFFEKEGITISIKFQAERFPF